LSKNYNGLQDSNSGGVESDHLRSILSQLFGQRSAERWAVGSVKNLFDQCFRNSSAWKLFVAASAVPALGRTLTRRRSSLQHRHRGYGHARRRQVRCVASAERQFRVVNDFSPAAVMANQQKEIRQAAAGYTTSHRID
jgi:hypothetical protein